VKINFVRYLINVRPFHKLLRILNGIFTQRQYTFYALLMTALVFAGCDKPTGAPGSDAAQGSSTSTSTLEGTITVEGSSTVEPITLKAKELFSAEHPKVNISISGQGTGNGFKSLAGKESDFSDASRPIKKKEFDACKSAGVEFIEVPVAYDGLSIVVNKENDFITELTIDQLKKIFREGNQLRNARLLRRSHRQKRQKRSTCRRQELHA